jgi:hypothetical protein
MGIKSLFAFFLFSGLLIFAGCKHDDLSKDAQVIGDAMCKNIEISGKLRAVNPNDTAAINKLQRESKALSTEMTILYTEFKEKWGEKAKDKEFSKKFSNELRKAMLNCPHLSKEDREQFKKDLEN